MAIEIRDLEPSYVNTYVLADLVNGRLPDFTSEPWWGTCVGGEIQVLSSDPSAVSIISYEELDATPSTANSSRLSSNSPWLRLASKEKIKTLRMIANVGTGVKIRFKAFSTYY